MDSNRRSAVAVGVADVKLADAVIVPGKQRTYLAITNTSTGGKIISLAFGANAVSLEGITLYATGTHSETLDNNFVPTQEEIHAICDGAGGTISIAERIGDVPSGRTNK